MLVVFGICFCNALSWGQLSLTEPQALWRRRQWQPTLVLVPGKSHGWRGLVGCSPWGCEESDTTEWLHFHFSLSCIWEGNGNPLLCSCLENPMGGGAWWAANYGVAQNQTQLKRLSSSSSRRMCPLTSLPACIWALHASSFHPGLLIVLLPAFVL